jgi:hypothetical protein
MEIKNYIVFEVKKDDAVFSFHMPMGSTWGKALDANFEVMDHIQKFIDDAIEKSKPQKEKCADKCCADKCAEAEAEPVRLNISNPKGVEDGVK